jgi:hypothetical protein
MGVSDQIFFNKSIFELFIFSNLQACFDYLHGLVKGSQSESLLLCILSRIICIRDDQTVRLVISMRKKFV